MSVTQILFTAFDVIFDFWPVLLLTPLKYRRGNLVSNMLKLWVFWAVVRVLLVFNPEPISASLVLPEPWSTSLFVVAGVILGAVWALQVSVSRNRLLSKAKQIQSREDLANLSPVEFENMVVELFRAMGHQAKRTGKSGDHGVDVVVRTKKGEKWVVQCKRWRKSVGEGVVRDLYGTLQHEKADGGMIIAANNFSMPAREWVRGKPIRLISGDEFLRSWQKVMRKRR
ncbi:MAG: restriction endonuclease [Gammaproteobacteria bacterium]|nr:MAG: restriction endonuclease [Gammaproteobacteria bacterium]